MAFEQFAGKQTFSGTDIMVIFSVAGVNLSYSTQNKGYKVSSEVQTLTVSSTTSFSPVRCCGKARPNDFGKGARTFAGSLVFTIMDNDPFQGIFGVDALHNSTVNDDSWHIDQMPPFDIIVVAQNETGGTGVQIITNARIVNYGTSYSVDDIYTEATYTYIAEDCTPFLTATNTSIQRPKIDINLPKTPDEYIHGSHRQYETAGINDSIKSYFKYFKPNSVYVYPKNTSVFTDPGIPQDVYTATLLNNNNLSDLS